MTNLGDYTRHLFVPTLQLLQQEQRWEDASSTLSGRKYLLACNIPPRGMTSALTLTVLTPSPTIRQHILHNLMCIALAAYINMLPYALKLHKWPFM